MGQPTVVDGYDRGIVGPGNLSRALGANAELPPAASLRGIRPEADLPDHRAVHHAELVDMRRAEVGITFTSGKAPCRTGR